MPPDNEEDLPEVTVTYLPRVEVLTVLGITPEEFESSLKVVLDRLDEIDSEDETNWDDLPPLEEMVLSINGKNYSVGELCEIKIEGDLESGPESA